MIKQRRPFSGEFQPDQAPDAIIGTWSLKILWNVELGIWSFEQSNINIRKPLPNSLTQPIFVVGLQSSARNQTLHRIQ